MGGLQPWHEGHPALAMHTQLQKAFLQPNCAESHGEGARTDSASKWPSHPTSSTALPPPALNYLLNWGRMVPEVSFLTGSWFGPSKTQTACRRCFHFLELLAGSPGHLLCSPLGHILTYRLEKDSHFTELLQDKAALPWAAGWRQWTRWWCLISLNTWKLVQKLKPSRRLQAGVSMFLAFQI